MKRQWIAALALLMLVAPERVDAQMFAYEPDRRGPVQALSIGAYLVDFTFDGVSPVEYRFDFVDPVLAVRYTRPSLDLSVGYGWNGGQSGDRKMIEANLLAWSGLLLNPRSETRIYLPLAVQSGYRAAGNDLSTNTAAEIFNFTTLGIGTGVIVERQFGSRAQLQARALPILALALRSFEGFAGRSRMFDGDLEFHLLRLFGRYGLTFAYGFRAQDWDVDARDFISTVPNDAFDYVNTQHMLRAGVNW